MADASINVTGATGGNVGTSIAVGISHGGIHVTGPDPLHDILARTKNEIDQVTADMIRVSAVDDVVHKMKDQHWVTITGNAGDGKTTLGYLVLKEFLQKNVRVYAIYKPEEYDQIENMKEERIIMFDDRFGAFHADRQKIDKWFDVIERILRKSDKQNTKVIFISRTNVVEKSKVYLGHLTESIFDRECVVDLSKRKLTKERLKILDYHLGRGNVTVQPFLRTRICNMEVAHGFPHCCKMFSKLRSKEYDISIEEFFRSPLKFLDMTTKVLYNDNCKTLFQLMIQHDGQLDIYAKINDEAERHDLFKVEKEQEGSYITVWRNGICQFAHPSVYESVLNVINDIDPLYCVQYATLSVIRQKMIISTSDEEDRSRSACYIIVKPIPAVLKALAERFRDEILEGDYSVFKHRLCQSWEFCEALVSCCVTTDEKEKCSKRFINQAGRRGRGKSNEETMLWTALRSGNIVAVCVLMREGASIQDVHDWYGRTPLHYLCEEKDSTSAADQHSIRMIIKEGEGNVNVCDKYGRTPLHYLLKHQTIPTEAIKFMIRGMESDLNCSDINGSTPLHCFCRREDNSVDLLKLMITEGGKVNQPDVYGSTPLHCLCRQSDISTDLLRLMITEGKGDLNKCEQYKSTPLHYLCANSSLQLDTVDLVIKEGKGDFNKGDEHETTPFHFLCSNGKTKLDVVRRIVKKAKGDINKQDDNGITPLHVLCKGSLPMENILTLINQGDEADIYGNTPLHFLCRRQGINAEVLQQQLEQIPETDLKKQNNLRYTPLDYLIDQDDRLPWTDGMIARSAADLVLCRLKHGDDWIYVLGEGQL